jgi:hypothetical protein
MASGDPSKVAITTSPPLAISADFVLQTADAAARAETVAGVLTFIPGGSVCVMVKTPHRQEMLLSLRELVIYYPERDLALVANVSPGKAPPMLEAIAAGVADPASTLPNPSKLLDQRRVNGSLYTRWRIVGDAGEDLGEMRALEARDGAVSIELISKAGKPQRRFSFGDRVRSGARSVPRSIVAEYFGSDGMRSRQEQWGLSNVRPFDRGTAALAGCARRGPKTKVQELPW